MMVVTWTKEITNPSTNTNVFSSRVWCTRLICLRATNLHHQLQHHFGSSSSLSGDSQSLFEGPIPDPSIRSLLAQKEPLNPLGSIIIAVLFMSPRWERLPSSLTVHAFPRSASRSSLPSLTFCFHSRLAALSSPSQPLSCPGGFMGSRLHLPTVACSDAPPWDKGSYPSPKNAGASTCQVMCLYLLKHLFHTVLGQGSIPAQNNANGHTFQLKSLRFKQACYRLDQWQPITV